MKLSPVCFRSEWLFALAFGVLSIASCSAVDPVGTTADGEDKDKDKASPSALPAGKPSRSRYFGIETKEPYIAMTFDDGPHPTETPRLLDMLKERGIQATFYVVGKNAKAFPKIIKRMVDEGHEVGNHTWNHPNLARLSNAKVRTELQTTHDAIVAACGVPPATLRAPFGSLKKTQREWIFAEWGYPSVMWAVDPEDWVRKNRKPSIVKNNILKATDAGEIVLAHDIHKSTVDAMPETLDALAAKGFKFVTVSQMFAIENSILEKKRADEAAAAAETDSENGDDEASGGAVENTGT